MLKVTAFYNWFQKLGGDHKNLDVEEVLKTLNEPNLLYLSFKWKGDEVKEKYNHKFQFKD